jgi:hypothetical protein
LCQLSPQDQKPSGERSEHHESPKKSQGIEPRQEREGEIIVIESDEGMKESFVFPFALVRGINKAFPGDWLEPYC